MQSIQISDAVYRRLQDQAARLRVTPEQIIERMLASELLPSGISDAEVEEPMPSPGSAQALAAVERLTTLFAASPLPNIDAILADPMLTLANADLNY